MSQASMQPTEVAEAPSTNVSLQPKEPQLTDQTRLLPHRQLLVVLFALSLCNLVTTVDQAVVSASLSTISSTFNAGSVSAWIPVAYLMTITAFQPLYGRLSDILGRKAAITLAMGIYIVGNLIAGFSRSVFQLIVFRVIAGVGDGEGNAAGVTAAGYTIGPIIGMTLFASVAIVFLLPLEAVQGDMRSKLLMIDYVGVFLTLGACTMIMLPLVWGGVSFPWSSAIILGLFIAGIVAVVILCLWEYKVARLPLIPMYIFRHMTVVGVYTGMFVNGYVFFSMLFYLPQFFQVILGYSPTRSGTFIIPFVFSLILSGVGAGIWVSRTGKYRFIIYVGYGAFAIACGCMTIFTAETSRVVMVVLMLIAGRGTGATMQTTTVAAQASVESVLTQMGITQSQADNILTQGYNKGFKNMFILNASLATLVLVASVALTRHKELLRGDEKRLKMEAKEALRKEKEKKETTEVVTKSNAQEFNKSSYSLVFKLDEHIQSGIEAFEASVVSVGFRLSYLLSSSMQQLISRFFWRLRFEPGGWYTSKEAGRVSSSLTSTQLLKSISLDVLGFAGQIYRRATPLITLYAFILIWNWGCYVKRSFHPIPPLQAHRFPMAMALFNVDQKYQCDVDQNLHLTVGVQYVVPSSGRDIDGHDLGTVTIPEEEEKEFFKRLGEISPDSHTPLVQIDNLLKKIPTLREVEASAINMETWNSIFLAMLEKGGSGAGQEIKNGYTDLITQLHRKHVKPFVGEPFPPVKTKVKTERHDTALSGN
ncbi:major facilitator superfamily domain-containing protein [Lentinula aciculospora]|uniref:Major facilitator superfamily domain-containing protein n=1 Tax=Lentinula aciculospora TaxID=153920 RepID=A0A9W9A0G0_9AGAR|nr:major facilitator superfamily domain-containing protein [Lentinula aciculospora]